MPRPILFDLFCGAGCAAKGYHDAGFEVVGVDINPQPNFPFEFIQADAIEFTRRGALGEASAIHASPPCQHFTKYGNSVKDIKDRYVNLLPETRALLIESGLPYVIENVEGSPLVNTILLCGSMFEGNGTNDLQRHRLFETNWFVWDPPRCDHSIWEENRYPGGRWKHRKQTDPTVTPSTPVRKTVEVGRWNIPLETQKWAMGVDWKIELRELSEGIPPAYTKWIGGRLMEEVRHEALLST